MKKMQIPILGLFLIVVALFFGSCKTGKMDKTVKKDLTYRMTQRNGVYQGVNVSIVQLRSNPNARLYLKGKVVLTPIAKPAASRWENGVLVYELPAEVLAIKDTVPGQVMSYDSAHKALRLKFTLNNDQNYKIWFKAVSSDSSAVFKLMPDSTINGKPVVFYGSYQYFVTEGADAVLQVKLLAKQPKQKIEVHEGVVPGVQAGNSSQQNTSTGSNSNSGKPAEQSKPVEPEKLDPFVPAGQQNQGTGGIGGTTIPPN